MNIAHGFPEHPNQPRSHGRRTVVLLFLAAILLVALASFILGEMQTSEQQAKYLSSLTKKLSFKVEPGTNHAMHFPKFGPYDERLGYVGIPSFIDSLSARGYEVAAQARLSPELSQIIDNNIFPIYHEKTQAGLIILDRTGRDLFSARFPERAYPDFSEVPPLVVDTLLFIENRELLDSTYPKRNPAIEWDRLFRIAGDAAVNVIVDDDHRTAGGSTLATQIEKYRHSPEGRTASSREKLRQMASASLRSYMEGEETSTARRRIIVDYINSVPLAARAGYGEVNGLGDGLWAWYGAQFDSVNKLLTSNPAPGSVEEAAQAAAYKQVLSLFLAQRRPSYYLAGGRENLNALANTYLDLMLKEGLITRQFRDLTRKTGLEFRRGSALKPTSFLESKATNAIRSRLISLMGLPRLYDLDRLDLTVNSTLDEQTQAAVTQVLRAVKGKEFAHTAGLYGHRLLAETDDLSRIIYSFTLLEHVDDANVVRVQTDNFDQPFDINAGVKLDLGSSAKLRTLVTYLDVVSLLHKRYSSMAKEQLQAVEVSSNDLLTRWAIDYLTTEKDTSLSAILSAALERRYSASPHESFFTGGGLHTFANFQKEDDSKVISVRQALHESVNLVFIRMMRDIVRYYMFQVPGSAGKLLEDTKDARRPLYLSRFADREGSEFTQRFYRKYKGKTAPEAMELLLSSSRNTPPQLATIYNSINPAADVKDFIKFMRMRLPNTTLSDDDLSALKGKYGIDKFSLPDRGYIARVHPLELWVVAYLRDHPTATATAVISAGANERQAVYSWLLKTRYKNAQDSRIRNLLEVEAFLEIHRAWKRLGYAFDSLVPSYATSIGSSADRPAALAELMGILVNDGMHYPTIRVERLHFGAKTPYETVIQRSASAGEQVLAPEVAQAVRGALLGVVEQGTARRVYKAFIKHDGSEIPIGGKTGTGDHRFDTYGAGGKVIQSRVVNRAAVFVFFIGDRFFGTITAYVPGQAAGDYHFTSALPVQLLKTLSPILMPLITAPKPAPAPPKVNIVATANNDMPKEVIHKTEP